MMRERKGTIHPVMIVATALALTLSGLIQVDPAGAGMNLSEAEQASADPRYRAGEYVNDGVKAFTNQEYDLAAQLFQKAIELDPDFPDDVPRLYLATAYMLQFVPGSTDPKSGQMAMKAIETFSDVVDRSMQSGQPNINAMLAVASISYQLKDFKRAKEWCNRVLQVEATADDMNKQKAEAHYRIAVMFFDDVHERTGILGDKAADMSRADKLQVLTDIEEGLSHLDQAIGTRPDYYEAMMYQNLLWRELEKIAENEEDKQKAIRFADEIYAKALKIKLKTETEAAAKRKTLNPGE